MSRVYGLIVVTIFLASGVASASHLATPPPRNEIGVDRQLAATNPLLAPHTATGTHWWTGVVYSGSSVTATSLAVTMRVPDDVSGPQDDWFSLLSAFDNNGSYDQIGISDFFGIWGVAINTGQSCTGQYATEDVAHQLDRGESYTFSMSINSGSVLFLVTNSSRSTAWSATERTGGSAFLEETFHWCGGSSYAGGYTLYEEVYSSDQSEPSYPVYFLHNEANGIAQENFTPFNNSAPGSPLAPPVPVAILPGEVVVENEAAGLSWATGGDSVRSEQGLIISSAIRVDPLNLAASNLNFTTEGVPSGWFVGLRQNGTEMDLTTIVASPSAAGRYVIEVLATDLSGRYTRLALAVTIVPPLVLSVTIPTGSAVDEGALVKIMVNSTGGAGPIHLNWSGLPPGCSMTGNVTFCTARSVASFLVTVSGVDALGYATSSSPLTLEVRPDPVVSLNPPSTTVDFGGNLTVKGVISGGVGPYTYSWIGLPPSCSTVTTIIVCQPSQAGNFASVLVVRDADGFVAEANASISVQGFLGYNMSPGEGLELVALIVCLAAIGAVALVVPRRPRARAPADRSFAQDVRNYGPGIPPAPPGGVVQPLSEAWSDAARTNEMSWYPAPQNDPRALGATSFPGGRHCAHCGTPNPPGALYCGRCGVPMTPGPEPSDVSSG